MKREKTKEQIQRLTELTKKLNYCDFQYDDWELRLKQLEDIYNDLASLAAEIPASQMLGANIINVRKLDGMGDEKMCVSFEVAIGELLQNIYYALQTKMMLMACVSAKWSCLFAAVAAIAACIGIGLTWWLN